MITMNRFLSIIMVAIATWTFAFTAAEAKPSKRYKARQPAAVQVHVDIGSQSMSVRVNGFPYAYWKVSTGRAGYSTPRGSFGVQRMAKVYYSRKYDNSPMPNSVFFHGGYAIHGTGYIRNLGRPASHGCVRLHPQNAARLFALVQKYGPRRTRITLSN
jgi:lipoprotein-anchoring transpeptidase ErfK/SrfK